MVFSSVRHIHFVGIGGIGMSGIAEILLSQGFSVSGSDLHRTDVTDHLASLGASICVGHSADHLGDAEVVVYSSAVRPDANPETRAALERKIPIIRRAEMLSEVSRLKYCLAIAGTHGKTTTTSMCGLVMMKAGMDPTVIVGGKLKGLGGSNARLGHGDWIVLEADEYDRSFLQLLPTIAIITNVEADHLDIYSDLDDIKEAFCEFTNKVPFYGTACVCIDDEGVRDILPSITRVVVTFGTSADAAVRATNIRYTERTTIFMLTVNGVDRGEIMLHVPGEHNVRNALATCAMALRCGISVETIRDGLADFGGVYRRFEHRGERDGVLVIDDYAHHPTEIRATIDAVRSGWPGRRVVAVFQPHTYTRTRDFVDDFASACAMADVVVLTDVYAAREQPIPGVTGRLLADAAIALGHTNVHYVPDVVNVAPELSPLLCSGDVVLTMGAGDIHKVATALVG